MKRLATWLGVPLILISAINCSKNPAAPATSSPESQEIPPYAYRVAASGLTNPTSLALAGDRTLILAQRPGVTQDASLVKLDLGSGELTLLGNGAEAPTGFAANRSGRIYWMDRSKGALMTQDGRNGAPTVLHSGGILPATSLAVDGEDRVYIAGATPALTGSDVAAVFVRGNTPSTIPDPGGPAKTALAASSSRDLYWTSRQDGVIYHRARDGRGSVLLSGLNQPQAIALDPSEDILYFTEIPTPGVSGEAGGLNTVNALDLATLKRTVIHRGDPEPAGIAVAANGNIYWTSASRGLVMVAVPAVAAATVPQFTALLTGSNEVPPVATKAKGQATFRLQAATSGTSSSGSRDSFSSGPSLTFKISITDIRRVQRVEIHQGAGGAVGPVVAVLSRGDDDGEDDDDGSSSGSEGYSLSGRLRPAGLKGPFAGNWQGFSDSLAAGGLYVNVITRRQPTGEIRGQILPPDASGNRAPKGAITAPAGDVTIQTGQSVNFAGTASDPDGDAVTVLWTFGDGTTSSALAPGSHTFPIAGTYTVRLTATDSRGLSDPAPPTRTITVQPTATNRPPSGTITAPVGNVTIAAGQSVSFAGTASDPDGDMVTVLWVFGDGSTSTLLAPGAHTFATAGTYTVRLTATDSRGLADPAPPSRTITVQAVTANRPPTAVITAPTGNVTITAGQSVTFSGTASDPDGDAITVLWDFGDGTSSTLLAPGAHTFATAGTYTVRLTATDSRGLAATNPPTRTITVNPAGGTTTLTQLQTGIFTPLCTGCHSAGGSAGLNLSPGSSFGNLVNVPATTLPGLRVVPGNPAASALVIQLQGGHRSVSAANQALISSWISAGALNN
jgi:PKD repeat protein/sugar lactone lactonase YvrE